MYGCYKGKTCSALESKANNVRACFINNVKLYIEKCLYKISVFPVYGFKIGLKSEVYNVLPLLDLLRFHLFVINNFKHK